MKSADFVQITGLRPQKRVGQEAGARRGLQAELSIFADVEQEHADDEAESERDREGGKDAANSPRVEFAETEAAALQPLGDQRGDEEAGNGEEDVDADETAVRRAGKIVIGDDASDSDRAQPIDVGPIRAEQRMRCRWLDQGSAALFQAQAGIGCAGGKLMANRARRQLRCGRRASGRAQRRARHFLKPSKPPTRTLASSTYWAMAKGRVCASWALRIQ